MSQALMSPKPSVALPSVRIKEPAKHHQYSKEISFESVKAVVRKLKDEQIELVERSNDNFGKRAKTIRSAVWSNFQVGTITHIVQKVGSGMESNGKRGREGV